MHRASHSGPEGARVADDGTLFNPGHGGLTRFGPFETGVGNRVHTSVPLLYLGGTDRAALYETVLHDQMPGSFVDHRRWALHRVSAVDLSVDLSLVSLHGEGLRSLSLYAGEITDTYPAEYPRTARWAAWLHGHVPAAAGLTWRSRQDNNERAYVLFGDRVPERALRPSRATGDAHQTLDLGYGAGLDWVLEVAAAIRVVVRLP